MKHLIPSVQNFWTSPTLTLPDFRRKGAPVGLNDFFSQETHGRRNSSRLGFHRIVRSSEFPPKFLGGNHQTSQLAAAHGKQAVGFLQSKNGEPGLRPV